MSTSMNSQENVLLLNMQFFWKKLQTFIHFFVKKVANQPSCAIFCKQNYIYLSCNYLWQLHILVTFCVDLQAISYNLLWTKMETFLMQSFLTNYKSSNDKFFFYHISFSFIFKYPKRSSPLSLMPKWQPTSNVFQILKSNFVPPYYSQNGSLLHFFMIYYLIFIKK